MKRDGHNKSLWQDTTAGEYISNNTKITPDTIFDVLIVGAGITGITTGLQLQKAGKSVLIAEAYNIGFGTTGGTTAHLNSFLDCSYADVQKKFSAQDAELLAEAVQQSLMLIKTNIDQYQINCEYKNLPAYLFSQNKTENEELENIFKATKEVNVDVEYTEQLPYKTAYEKALVFMQQAQFHPLKYLNGIAKAFTDEAGIILENCRITGLTENEVLEIESNRGILKARNIIYATHIPPGVNLLHFRCAPYRSYALSLILNREEDYPDALIYDMEDPYHYIRTQEIDGKKYLIVGGEDHKTGHETNTQTCFSKLESYARKHFQIAEITHKWSSQYFEPADGLAYIGHLPGTEDNVFVATGYGGNGMVYAGIAAIILTDLIVKGKNKFEELLDPNRIKMVAGFKNFTKEAADVVQKLIATVVPPEALHELAGIAPGEAKLVKYEGSRLAVYKDESGNIHAVNPACTHIKCEVAWNNTEKSWDCPCHGSRFDIDGKVLTAPARKNLEQVNVETLLEKEMEKSGK